MQYLAEAQAGNRAMLPLPLNAPRFYFTRNRYIKLLLNNINHFLFLYVYGFNG